MSEELRRIALLEAEVESIKRRLAMPPASNVSETGPSTGPLEDGVVRFDPKFWKGPSMKGRNYSECPSDFLLMLAKALDYFSAQKAETDPKKSGWDARDAARARAWAARNQGALGAAVTEEENPF